MLGIIFFIMMLILFLYRDSIFRLLPIKHVIIISLDTTRADHLGCYGHPRIRTPSLDAVAKNALVFDNAISVSSTTLPSHTSLFSGKYPKNHGTPANGYVIDLKNIMLPEILKERGFETVGFIGAFPLSKWFGFAQGFDVFDEAFDRYVADQKVSVHQRSAAAVTDAVVKYFKSGILPEHLFLFVHYYDPHNPYNPPRLYKRLFRTKYTRKGLKSGNLTPDSKVARVLKTQAYEAEVTYMDRHIERLLNFLKKLEMLDESVLIITSDHGENMLWDTHPFSHGWDTYQAVIKAVCMIRTPETVGTGRISEQLTANIDILPSLLNYLRISAHPHLDGECLSLTEPFNQSDDRPRFAECTKPEKCEDNGTWRNYLNARCVYQGSFKYIYTPHANLEEFFNISQDPFEKQNLITSTDPKISAQIESMKKELAQWFHATPYWHYEVKKDPSLETIQKLEALGYL
ncbi:sulfatase [candidate division CSSED10-310 bacterium]|uniref:Sulfatase n=1 Tax=candidate division CSSED10-310 bacterium TaxID=2855610 RepID=A0ABV6YRQ9_UNCC1